MLVSRIVLASLVAAGTTFHDPVVEQQPNSPAQEKTKRPRLVRIIWEVGTGNVFYKHESLDGAIESFAFPTNRNKWGEPPAGYTKLDTAGSTKTTSMVERGDRVRLYVTDYNPVSHVAEKAAVTVIADEVPDFSRLLFNLLAVASSGAFAPREERDRVRDPDPDPCTGTRFDACLDDIKKHLDDESEEGPHGPSLTKLVADLQGPKCTHPQGNIEFATYAAIGALDTTVKEIRQSAWGKFHNVDAANTLTSGLDKATKIPRCGLDSTYSDFLRSQAQTVEDFNKKNVLVATRFATFDKIFGLEAVDDPQDRLRNRRQRLWLAYEALIKDPMVNIAKLTNVTKLAGDPDGDIKGKYLSMLDISNEENYVIEISVPGEAKAGADIVVDQPFKTTVKDSQQRAHRSLVVKVAPHYPVTFTSVGFGYIHNGFGFQTNTLVHEVGDPSKNRFEQVDGSKYRDLTAVLLTHFTVSPVARWLYATLGTTADKNVFENIVIAGSFLHPRTRATISVGAIGAKGAREDVLKTIASDFSDDDGFALPGVDLSRVPTGIEWHWSFFVAASFRVF